MITGLSIHNQINKKNEPVKKEQNIQAFVRVRPFSVYELNQGVTTVPIRVSDSSKEVLCEYKGTTRQYKFDHVFDQDSIQSEVFNIAVKPICDEVLLGFNGTIFVYGQTGTGKTHTMEGKHGSNEDMGIIPRTINYLFQCLEQSGADYNIRASHLEIYKEEIFDLLACNGNENLNKPLGMFDTQKGFKIPELEEIVVNDRQSILNVLAKSCKRRQTAETQYNKQSSRSHCIFSITVHVKETSVGGEDLIKIGKLNLVDLAGSENAEKSGNNDRLREAALINKSLLTLGKVITDLTNNEKHIPYRSSQLTKILQDSLGGKTKTSIIATVSPSLVNLEETINTLEYALKAKNIKNTPQINQRMSKNSLLKEQSSEIAHLKQLLQAAYDKNGVYLTIDVYEQMKRELEEKCSQQSITEHKMEAQRHEISSMRKSFDEQTMLFEEAMNELESSKKQQQEKQKFIDQFISQDTMLRSNLGSAVQDLSKLHEKLDTMKSTERENQKSIIDSKSILSKRLTDLNQMLVSKLQMGQNELLESLSVQLKVVHDQQTKSNQLIGKRINNLSQLIDSSVLQIQQLNNDDKQQTQPLLKLNKESNDLFMKLDKTIQQLSDQIKIILSDFSLPFFNSNNNNSNNGDEIIDDSLINNCFKLINDHVNKSDLIVSQQNKLIQEFSESMSQWMLHQSQYIIEQRDYQKQLKEKQILNNTQWEKKLLSKLGQVIQQFSKNFTDSTSVYYDTMDNNLQHFEKQFNSINNHSRQQVESLSNNLQQSSTLSHQFESTVKSVLNDHHANNKKVDPKLIESIEKAKKRINQLTDGCIDLSQRQRQCTNQFNEAFTDFTFGIQSQKDILDRVIIEKNQVHEILPLIEKSKSTFKENIDTLIHSLDSRKSIIQSSTNECSNQLNSLISSIPSYLDSAIKVTSKSGETPSKKHFDIPSPISTSSSSSSSSSISSIHSNAGGKENNHQSINNSIKSNNFDGSKSINCDNMKIDTPQKSSTIPITPKSLKLNLNSTPKSVSKNLKSSQQQQPLIVPSSNQLTLSAKKLSNKEYQRLQQQQQQQQQEQQQQQSAKKKKLAIEKQLMITTSPTLSLVNESPFSSPKLSKQKILQDQIQPPQPPSILSQLNSTPISFLQPQQPQQQPPSFFNNLNGSFNRGNNSIDFSLLDDDSDSDNSDDDVRSLLSSNKKSSRASKNAVVSKKVGLTPSRKLKGVNSSANQSLNVKKSKPILTSLSKKQNISTPIIHSSKPSIFGGGSTISSKLKSLKQQTPLK
ncbi:kinesin family member 13 [Dictyostelium discoideum AX4]|uniref:Kinesin-related protein 13 n=1 Tax=Dictyostelium discoideum TaxID=44689 RepID=KIF13_DICDI|nr:kinesin family member 13 [Dictyostelium discoideum AX4]Q6RZZ9.1 RecName: Full=Kinesin-related protein 13; AltName: Full=Kinesin family member 13; AltName: Full=Kinesin-5 [Dictyostelium discoideum]AAR39442.1 kinesin family member 13 [Dictyostelium discoideum]EAL63277.1 kinesin family member 13 [Dictyostelium discoideum AX4]|eukprot:XP_636780.1 kinesin family member 13 [Dictyostelium discoideum AX4]